MNDHNVLANGLPIENVLPGVWLDDVTVYPDTKDHRKKNLSLYEFDYLGYKCSIKRNFSLCWCGYVELSTNHPDYGKYYDDVDVQVHGGLTYSKDGKFGFDCAHGSDVIPDVNYHGVTLPNFSNSNRVYRDYNYIVDQVKQLAEQFYDRENEVSVARRQ